MLMVRLEIGINADGNNYYELPTYNIFKEVIRHACDIFNIAVDVTYIVNAF